MNVQSPEVAARTRRNVGWRAGALLAAVVSAGVYLSADAQEPQPEPPVFRSGTDLVQVDVAVLDGRRQPVTGLTAADFVVLEDGEPREVETFAAVDLADRIVATDAAWMSEVPHDVADNRITDQEGRLVVLLMDRSIPVGPPTLIARQVATAAVEELGPGDMAALVSTGGGVPQNFTADHTRLLRAINQRDWSTGVGLEAAEISDAIHAEGLFTELTDGRCLCGLCSQQAITRIADALTDLPRRRKSIFFIGSNLTIQAGPQLQQAELGCGMKLEDARKAMFDALDRSGVTVHAIDPSGLNLVGPTTQAASTLRGGRAQVARAQAVDTHLQNQGELGILPDRTGGRTVMNTNGPEDRVPEIIRESQSYYLLGFRPSDAGEPGRVRSIEVKVDRRGVKVHARRQFVVATDGLATTDPDAGGAAALAGLLPRAGLPMDLNVAAFADPVSKGAVVAVSVGVESFAPPGGETTNEVPIDVTAVAYDATGRAQGAARQTLRLSWPRASTPPGVPEHAAAGGPHLPVTGGGGLNSRRVNVLSRLDLAPGDYEIRVAASHGADGPASSVFTHVSVPAFSSAPLSVSHIVIAAGAATSTAPPDFLADVLPVRPTTQRVFRGSEATTAFVRVYQGTGRDDSLQPVHVRVRIVDGSDHEVRDEIIALGPGAFGTARTADLRLTLPLARLPAGPYLLRLEASTDEHLAGRAIRFVIE